MARIVKLKFKKTLGSTKVFDYCPLSTQIAVSHIDSDLIEPGDAVLLLETKGKKTDVRTYSSLQFNQLLDEQKENTLNLHIFRPTDIKCEVDVHVNVRVARSKNRNKLPMEQFETT